MLFDLLQLIYPNCCSSCGNSISYSERVICEPCYSQLGTCPYGQHQIHPMEKALWGRGRIEAATGLFVFTKQSVGQRLLHQLKYQNDMDAGYFLGKLLGRKLATWHRFKDVEAMIPVPITAKKRQIRGYNQSEIICQGIQQEWPKPVITNYLTRALNTDSQTKKGRLDRASNTDGAFLLNSNCHHSFRKVLLIDDVMTTGATIEASAGPLLLNHKVCVATIAYQ